MTSPPKSALIPRHKTALVRRDLSRPIRAALEDQALIPGDTVLDYGCGHGGDVRALMALGYPCAGWDPVFRPEVECLTADVVNLGYVINVIEDIRERVQVLQNAWKLTKRMLIVSGRLISDDPRTEVRAFADGIVTRLGTFQKFYDQMELKAWIVANVDEEPMAAAPGIFYVFRDRERRAAVQTSRFRRPQTIRVPNTRLTPEYAQQLAPLRDFIEFRGRLPELDELKEAESIRVTFGSLKRAWRLLERASGSSVWGAVRAARSEDLLVYVALSCFEGSPRFSTLPRTIQRDVLAFFGSYTSACKAADALLFSLRDSDRIDEACRTAPFGKLLPSALYVHASAVGGLPILLRLFEGCARSYIGTIPEANVLKMGRRDAKVSYLSYPQFETAAHPVLAASTSVDLQTFKIRSRTYSDRANPPILHRKDAFLPADHALKPKFERLTRIEEDKGLFEDPSSIGTRDGWSRALRNKGLALRGHRVIAVPAAPRAAAHEGDTTRAFYEANALAYARETLGLQPHPWLVRFARAFGSGQRVLDIGCGAGRDLTLMRRRDLDVVGLDASANMLKIAGHIAKAPVVAADARRLPFPSGSFSGVWASAALFHLQRGELLEALQGICRVLKRQGTFFLSMKLGAGALLGTDGRRFTFVDEGEMQTLVRAAGFVVQDLRIDRDDRTHDLVGAGKWISVLAAPR